MPISENTAAIITQTNEILGQPPIQVSTNSQISDYISVENINILNFGGQHVVTDQNVQTIANQVFGLGSAIVNENIVFFQGNPMPEQLYKVQLVYQFYRQGFVENFWCSTSNPKQSINFDSNQINKLINFRARGTKFLAAKASLWNNPRESVLTTYGQSNDIVGVVESAANSDVTSTSAYCQLQALNGKSRASQIRGWRDELVKRNPDGSPFLSAAVVQYLSDYLGVLRQAPAYGIGFMSPPSEVATAKHGVKSMTQVSGGICSVLLDIADYTALTAGRLNNGKIVFSGAGRKKLMNLKGVFDIIGLASPAVLIHYTLPANQTVYTPQAPIFVRNVVMNFSAFDSLAAGHNGLKFIDWRSRKTGKGVGFTKGRSATQTPRN